VGDANRRFNTVTTGSPRKPYLAKAVVCLVFTSPRQDYADIEKKQRTGMQAANKAFGKEATLKMLHDWESWLVWSRSELRRRRPDLSRKAPTDMDSYAKLIGESRVLRTPRCTCAPDTLPTSKN